MSLSKKIQRPAALPRVLTALAIAVSIHVGSRAIVAAGDDAVFELRAQDGHFQPSELLVPSNRPFSIRVINAEIAAIEFESFELHRERVVQPGETIVVLIPALGAGTYKFFVDFHRDTPEGSIVVK